MEHTTITLSDAVAFKLARTQRREDFSPRTVERIRECFALLSPWAQRPICTITRAEADNLHRQLTVANGPGAANRALREFRSLYNLCLRLFEDMPDKRPTCVIQWNKEKVCRDTLGWKDLPGWFAEIDKLTPVRRTLQLFYLFTGVRRTEATGLKWTDVDLVSGTAHIARPKGGVDRAYDIPLSMPLIALLARLPRQNDWVFPAGRGEGPLINPRQYEWVAPGKRKFSTPGPHTLRRTFCTAADQAGVAWNTACRLVNHKIAGVHQMYVNPDVEALREAANKTATFLLAKAGRDCLNLPQPLNYA